MIFDKTGSLAATKRHDYLPFGEEIGGAQVALIGGRTTTQGYTTDSTRQHFTGYELDAETGLNFAQARYQSSVQGRFTSVDPLGASANIVNPQSFNRYSYVNNNPVNLTDPSGMLTPNPATGMVQTDDESYARTLQGASDAANHSQINGQFAVRNGLSLKGISNGSTIRYSVVGPFDDLDFSQSHLGGGGVQEAAASSDADDVVSVTTKASGTEESESFWQHRYARELQTDIAGTTIVWNKNERRIQWILFAQDYDQTLAALTGKGYLSGPLNFAFNPYHHGGGTEFRDPASKWGKLNFHFMIPYKEFAIFWLPPGLGSPVFYKDGSAAVGSHVHVDQENPSTQLVPHANRFFSSVWEDVQRRFGWR